MGQRVTVGLGNVEHVRDPHPDQNPPVTGPRLVGGSGSTSDAGGCATQLVAVRSVDVLASQHWGEDLDALLALADLPTQGLPGAVAGDLHRIGALHEDRDRVVERVVVKLRRGLQPRLPCGPVGQGQHLVGQPLMEGL